MNTQMQFNWRQFGDDLRAYRERRKIGLREFCEQQPIDKATMSRAENGRPVEVPHFVFLCEWIRRRPNKYAVQAPRPRK